MWRYAKSVCRVERPYLIGHFLFWIVLAKEEIFLALPRLGRAHFEGSLVVLAMQRSIIFQRIIEDRRVVGYEREGNSGHQELLWSNLIRLT